MASRRCCAGSIRRAVSSCRRISSESPKRLPDRADWRRGAPTRLRQLDEWTDGLEMPLTVSVNLSLRQLEDPDLPELLERLAAEHAFDRWRLRLEITESAIMEEAEAAMAIFSKIRALGIDLAVDDFGTGYSSLSHLVNMPITTLKIDRSFVANRPSKEIPMCMIAAECDDGKARATARRRAERVRGRDSRT